MEIHEANEYYRGKVIEMVNKFEDPDFLEFVYNLLQSFRKEWGVIMKK